jgi:hypothetical protein
MVVHACNPSTQETMAGGLWIWIQPGLYSETLYLKTKSFRGNKEKKRQGTKEPDAGWSQGIFFSFLFLFFFGGTGVWTQALTLDRQGLYHLNRSISTFFVLGIFKIGSLKLLVLTGLEPLSSWSVPPE